MKPGKGDIASYLLITGQELVEIKRFDFPESFGLGGRVERYQGKRPIKLYRWDIECLIETIADAIKRSDYYPNKESASYKAVVDLQQRLELLYIEISRDD
jgi:hypothetical protein